MKYSVMIALTAVLLLVGFCSLPAHSAQQFKDGSGYAEPDDKACYKIEEGTKWLRESRGQIPLFSFQWGGDKWIYYANPTTGAWLQAVERKKEDLICIKLWGHKFRADSQYGGPQL